MNTLFLIVSFWFFAIGVHAFFAGQDKLKPKYPAEVYFLGTPLMFIASGLFAIAGVLA